MQVRPFRLLGATDLAEVEARLAAAVEAWRLEWLPASEPPTVSCVPAHKSPCAAAELRWLSAGTGGAAIYQGTRLDAPNALQRLLFGAVAAQHPSELAGEVAQKALAALAVACLPGAEVIPAGVPAAHDWTRGSGAVCASLAWPGLELLLVLDGEAISRLLADSPRRAPPRRPPLGDPRAAVGSGRVEVRASTGAAEIDVATFRSLAVGDVIRLDLRIDQPLRLTVGGQPTTRRAYLGVQAGRRALSLTATAEPFPSKNQESPHVRTPE